MEGRPSLSARREVTRSLSRPQWATASCKTKRPSRFMVRYICPSVQIKSMDMFFQKAANGSIARRHWCSNPTKRDNYFSASVAPLKLQCWIFASGSRLLLISAKRHPAWTGGRSEVCFCVAFRIFPLTCSRVFL